jgi:hypothetical protein
MRYFYCPSVTIPAITANNGELTTCRNISKKYFTTINISKLVMVRTGRAFTECEASTLTFLALSSTYIKKSQNYACMSLKFSKLNGDKKNILI